MGTTFYHILWWHRTTFVLPYILHRHARNLVFLFLQYYSYNTGVCNDIVRPDGPRNQEFSRYIARNVITDDRSARSFGPARESAAFLFSPRQSQLNSKLHFNLFLRLSWAIGSSLLQLRKLFSTVQSSTRLVGLVSSTVASRPVYYFYGISIYKRAFKTFRRNESRYST